MRFDLNNSDATLEFAAKLADISKKGDFIALFGDLGMGKTTFSRGFINALLGDIEVPSPTFTLLQTYDYEIPIYHFDLYRLKSPEEIWELGWEDIIDGISLVEWPQMAGEYLPKNRLEIHLQQNANGRIALLKPNGANWEARLEKVKNAFI